MIYIYNSNFSLENGGQGLSACLVCVANHNLTSKSQLLQQLECLGVKSSPK